MVKVSGQEKTEPMDALELRKLGAGFSVGEDLYGVSLVQLTERLEILRAEMARIEAEIQKKDVELSKAENFFKKS
jgi:uncharacterized small protein (DUF1192 family)